MRAYGRGADVQRKSIALRDPVAVDLDQFLDAFGQGLAVKLGQKKPLAGTRAEAPWSLSRAVCHVELCCLMHERHVWNGV